MIIKLIKDSNPNGHGTLGEWFDTGLVMPSYIIANWDDVVTNIKVNKIKMHVESEYCLFGNEYPADTPLYVDESITKGFERPIEEGESGATGE